jgi:hopanoid biosynthesis associated protein HpnK
VVNADDFGASRSINQAVIRAHQDGILTSASLMVNGDAAAEAVELARQHPSLGVGLHLTLIRSRSCLDAAALAGRVGRRERFSDRPVFAGLRYYFERRRHADLEREVAAQFERFKSTGLVLDHVNGHLHFHMHPTVVGILLRRAREWGVRAMRLTRDPLWLNLRLSRGHYGYRVSHALVFRVLGRWIGPRLRLSGIRCTDRVFGLLQNGRVNLGYLERLIPCLPPGDSELYSHPSLDEFRAELEALIAPRVRALVEEHRVTLARYQDL